MIRIGDREIPCVSGKDKLYLYLIEVCRAKKRSVLVLHDKSIC